MKMKKVLSLVLATTCVCGSIGFAAPAEKPAEGSNFYRAYVKGYEDDTVRPDGAITRAEAVTIYTRLKENSQKVSAAESSKFSDVSADSWYKSYVDYAVADGVINGYEDGTFKPDNAITRAEFVKILSSAVADAQGVEAAEFSDVPEGHWAKKPIDKLSEAKIVNGYGDGTFGPDKNITRAEAVKMLNLIYDRITDKSSLEGIDKEALKKFSDLSEEHWAYYNLVDAVNNHVAERKADSAAYKWTKVISDSAVEEAEKYLTSEADALKALGLKEEIKSVIGLSWVDINNILGSGANLVGVPDDHHLDASVLEDYTNITDHEGNYLFDVIKELKPGVIYTDKKTLDDEKNAELKKVLDELGTKQAYLPVNRFADLLKNMGILASASGSEGKFIVNMAEFQDRVDAVKDKSEKNGNPSVALIIMTDSKDKTEKEYYIAAEDSFAADVVKLGGFKNIGDEFKGEEKDRFGFVKTSLEDIMAKDPDSVVLMLRTDKKTRAADEKAFDKALKEKYADSKAVKSGKYGRIDHHGILPKSTLAYSGLEAISGIANKTEYKEVTEFVDGVYEGEGTGFAADLKTRVTVKDKKITEVVVTECNDTKGVAEKAIDNVPGEIVKAQKADVDVVSGATMTSRGIIESVKDALSKMADSISGK